MLTVGELQHLLNTYQARNGLSPNSIVEVEIYYGDEMCETYSATMVSCHVERQEATIHAYRDEEGCNIGKERLKKAVGALAESYQQSEVPDDFSFFRQSYYERCEAWMRHAMQRLNEELAAFRAHGDPEGGEQSEERGTNNET